MSSLVTEKLHPFLRDGVFFTQMKMGTQFNNKNCCNNFGNEHKLFESTVNEVNITMFNDSQIRVGVEYV